MGLADPRSYGSGNPGATNVLRSGSRTAALLTLLGDCAKGALAVMLVRSLSPTLGLGPQTLGQVAVAAFIGHLFPVFFGFKGGKGVATALGILVSLSPVLGLLAAVVWFLLLAATRFVSVASVGAALGAAVAAPALVGGRSLMAAVFLIAALVVLRHRANIRRLLAGEESRFTLRRSNPPPR